MPLEYDPHRPLDPEKWLALHETLRLESVRRYHRRNRISLPNEKVHAAVHVIVENQLATGDPQATRVALSRLNERIRIVPSGISQLVACVPSTHLPETVFSLREWR